MDLDAVRIAAEAVVDRLPVRARERPGEHGLATRFGMLTAPRSTVVQPSPIHAGVTADPERTLPTDDQARRASAPLGQDNPSTGGVGRTARLRAMLRLDDYYIWDSWMADDGDLYHLFFLQAPRSLGSPGAAAPQRDGRARHLAATWSTGTTWASASARRSRAGTTWRSGPARWSATAATGGCSTPRSTREATASTTSGSARRSPTTCTTGPGSATSRRPPATPAGTRRSPHTPPPEPYLAPLEGRSETWRDPLVFPTPTATAGTC